MCKVTSLNTIIVEFRFFDDHYLGETFRDISLVLSLFICVCGDIVVGKLLPVVIFI